MKKSVFLPLLAILFLLNLYLLAPQTLGINDVFSKLNLLVDVRHQLVNGYVEAPNQDKMIESAVRGMIGSLEDPYTSYLSPDEFQAFDRETGGSFSGIGAEVTIDPVVRRLKIISPIEESAAWKAGILAGDIVLSIDGQDTENMEINVAVKKLVGKEGTNVTLRVRHESAEEQTLTITRAQVMIKTIRGFRRDADNHWIFMLDDQHKIGYIRLTQFSEPTARDLRAALEQLVAQGVKGIILDVRFNGGGLLDSAVDVSDMFLPEGKTIVSVRGRAVPEEVHTAKADQINPAIEMVILANEYSASAAEIVTGALHDNGRAKFIGTRTFGKGSVQQVKQLGQHLGALKMTNAYYYIPSGRKIHKTPDVQAWGVDPADGFFVPMSITELKKMNDARREGDILRPQSAKAEDRITPQWLREKASDPQLAAGLEALLGKFEKGEWPTVGQSGAKELARQQAHNNLVRQRELLVERLELVNGEIKKLESGVDPAKVKVDPDELASESVKDQKGLKPDAKDVIAPDKKKEPEEGTIKK